ncbi:hypothetical protein [Prochlorothrix hollandica]|uniref:hypothetical protein n=1 Tax=Prochlorothrix hollandica TaxID=1223 RepID=UPI003342A58B
MKGHWQLPDTADLYTTASVTGELSQTDFRTVQLTLRSPSLQDEERRCMQRLVYAVRRGHVRAVS